ncbi:MAG: SGNH/GDSL hydrolase family protein, partial [Acidimicrobiales bacterium]
TAYGPELAKRFSVGSFQYVACSGAVTADLFSANHEYGSEAPQLSVLSPQTSVVTLTIGGNDVGFASILEACVYGIGYNAPGCSQNPAVTGMVDYNLAALSNLSTTCPSSGLPVSEASGTPMTSWLCVLLAIHADAPNAVIDLVGYPPLFGNFTASSCQVGTLDGFYPLYIGQGDARWLNSVQAQSVTDEEAAVSVAKSMGVRAYFADVSPQFAGHGFCDSGTTYFHPITVTTSLGGTLTAPGSMHPNAQGISADVRAIERSL